MAAPELWSPRRTAGEVVLGLVLGVMAAGTEELMGSEGARLLAVGAAATLLSLLRRRMPTPVLLVTAVLAPLVSGFAPLLLIVGWSAGRRIVGAGRVMAAFTVAYALFIGTTLLEGWAPSATLTLVLLSTLYFLATTLVPGLASRYWTQRRTLLHALQERNAQLLRERAMVAGQARLMERQRIAQDMHDSLGHQLALISVHTGALEVDPQLTPQQREAVGVLRNASVTAMHELREVVGILRDGVEAPSAPVDDSGRVTRGTAGIDGLVEAARAAGNEVELRRAGDERPLAAAADHAAYRIAQEALTNAYKHAPGARIDVELRYEPDSLVVEIVSGQVDAAARGAVVSGGQGLTGLRERARLVGGIVHAGPASGGGFRVAGMLPYGVVEATPLLAAEDDFHQQSPRARYDDGVPVMDWSVTERLPVRDGQGEHPGGQWAYPGGQLTLPGAEGRSRAGGIAMGCAIALAALLVLGAAGIFGLFFLVGSMDEGMIDPAEYRSVRIGDDEDAVRDRLPPGDSIMTTGLSGKGPKEPEGSECLVLMSSDVGDNMETEPVFRFCFRDGKLIEKKAYEVAR
ncbi:sensor histidine kinase [Streptomyces sp. NPDC056437]|uniref:sensor histidine kinase n=1 Tax=Streptomyces sp. NPDC056437 TaxID=3345816 RepID=UPI0036CCA6D8